MTFTKTIVNNAVDRHFQAPNAARAARRQVFILLGTALVVLAALQATDYLSWALWAWVAYRVSIFVMLLVIGPQLSDELTRRLDALPPAIRAALAGGAR